MRRFAALLLAICLLISLSACGTEEPPITPTATAEAEDLSAKIPMDEWERAAWYGFLPEDAGDPDSAVTWAQFCAMLGKAISLYDKSRLPAWEEETVDAPEEEMRRDGGMVALLFGAKAMGLASFNALVGDYFGEYAGRVWEVVTMDYPLFAWDAPIDLGEGCADNNHVGPAYDFSQRRVSLVSGLPLLEFDEAGDLRLEQPFTIEEAALAVLRLYESEESCAAPAIEARDKAFLSNPEVQAILTQADERREAIRSSETTIVKSDTFVKGETYTGTAYYVSNGGSDDQDGLSPATAFATPAALDHVTLQYGDAVFFERGSVWRGVSLPSSAAWTEGVTFSAYGEGEKPRFLGSLENGAGGEKWTLAYEGVDGRKIWVYSTEMTEVAGIVLNEETVANRDKAYWNGSEYQVVDENYWPLEEGAVYSVEEHLPDGYCFPDLRYPENRQGLYNDRIFHTWNEAENRYDYVTGKLYFRCDAGNPGELYDSIEFIQPFPLVDGFADNQVYDNLCILFSSMTFVSGSADGVPTGNHSVIQNMEVGFMGGNVTGYRPASGSDDHISYNCGSMGCNGGGMAFNGSGITVRNNYVHHTFQEGIALELFEDCPTMESCTISGNLVECCTQAILLCNWDEEAVDGHIFRNMVVEENLVLYSGQDNWFNSVLEEAFCDAIVLQGGPCAHDGTVQVRNNTFAFATGALILVDRYSEEYSHVFTDNTYVQTPDGTGLYLADSGTALTLREGIALLGDDGAVVIEG